jgi:hypothetical protein
MLKYKVSRQIINTNLDFFLHNINIDAGGSHISDGHENTNSTNIDVPSIPVHYGTNMFLIFLCIFKAFF